MQSIIDEIHELDAEVIAISTDSPESCSSLAMKKRLSYPLLSDIRFEAIDAFGVRHPKGGTEDKDIARPATFILNSSGKVVWRNQTENWRVRPSPQSIIEQLRQLP